MRNLTVLVVVAAAIGGCKGDLPAATGGSDGGSDSATDPTTTGSTTTTGTGGPTGTAASGTGGTSDATDSGGATSGGTGAGTSGTGGASTGQACPADGAEGCACASGFSCDGALFCVADTCTSQDPFSTLKMGIAAPEGLAVDGERLFYAVGTQGARQIRVYDLSDDSDSLVTQGHQKINGLTARNGQIYFTQAAGDLTRIDADNLQDVEVVSIANPRSVAAGPTHVAVGQVETQLLLMPVGDLQNGALVPINQAVGPGDSVYVTATHVFLGTATENSNSTVHQMALGDGSMEWIHDQPYWVRGVAAVTTNVYWASMGWPPDTGEVLRKSIGGGGESVVATGGTLIGDLATDGTSVFWTEPGDITMGDPGAVGAIVRHTPGAGTGPVADGLWIPAFVRAGADSVFWINLGDGVNASLERRLK